MGEWTDRQTYRELSIIGTPILSKETLVLHIMNLRLSHVDGSLQSQEGPLRVDYDR